MPGDFRTRDGANGVIPFDIGFENDEDTEEAAKNSADLFLLNMKKRRRKLFTKMSAGEEDCMGNRINEYDDDDIDDDDDEDEDEDEDDEDEDEDEDDDDEDEREFDEDDEEEQFELAQLAQMENRHRLMAAASLKNGQIFYQNNSAETGGQSSVKLNKDIIDSLAGKQLPSFMSQKDIGGELSQEKLAYLMLKQQEQHQQMLDAAASINLNMQENNAQYENEPIYDENLNKAMFNMMIRQENPQSNQYSKNLMNNDLDYQKWLISTGRQHLIKPHNYEQQNYASAMPQNQHQGVTKIVHNNQYVNKPQPSRNNPPENTGKLSEVEKIKQELLGYQREIELMEKQREHAKLMKQQKQHQQELNKLKTECK